MSYTSTPQYPYSPPAAPRTSGLAIAALLTAIFFWPVGIVMSPIALARVRRTGEGGRGLAIAGLIIAIVELIVTIIVVILIAIAATFTAVGVAVLAESLDEMRTVDESVAPGETGTTGGDVTFTLDALECGIASVGSGDQSITASGEFCAATVTVGTAADYPVTVTDVYASGYIGDKQIDADPLAEAFSTDVDVFDSAIGPGEQVVTTVYFDVPLGADLDRVTFSEEMFGGMVEVVL